MNSMFSSFSKAISILVITMGKFLKESVLGGRAGASSLESGRRVGKKSVSGAAFSPDKSYK